jgi:hypothetical protein
MAGQFTFGFGADDSESVLDQSSQTRALEDGNSESLAKAQKHPIEELVGVVAPDTHHPFLGTSPT